MSQQSASSARGWVVTISALCINLVLGVLYAWGVMGKALSAQLHWSRTAASLPFMAATIAFAVSMIFAGRVQDKIGPRKVAILGGVLLGVGFIASAWATSPAIMVFTFGVIGGAGIGLGYSATTPPCLKWFPPQRKGLIAGIVVSGVGLAAVYMAPLTQKLLGMYTISQTFMVLGVFTIVVVTIMTTFLSNPPAGYVPAAAAAGPAKKQAVARPDVNWPQMLGTPAFWLLWLTMILGASAGLMIISQVPFIAKNQVGIEKAAGLVMLVAIFNTLGRLISGTLSDKLGRTNTILLCFALQAVNMFCFRFYTTPALITFGAATAGILYGPVFSLFPTASADFFGLKNLGVNYGILFTSFGVAGTVGPLVSAHLADKNGGSYSQAYIVCGIMLVVGALLALATKAPKADATAR